MRSGLRKKSGAEIDVSVKVANPKVAVGEVGLF